MENLWYLAGAAAFIWFINQASKEIKNNIRETVIEALEEYHGVPRHTDNN